MQQRSSRVLRLLETRKQALAHAAKVREEFKKHKLMDQERKRDILKEAWKHAKEEDVSILKKELEKVMSNVGSAYYEARRVGKENYQEALEKQKAMEQSIKRQNIRYKHALKHEKYNEYKRNEPMLRKKESLEQVRNFEDERAREQAMKQRLAAKYKKDDIKSKCCVAEKQERVAIDYSKSFFHMRSTAPGSCVQEEGSKRVNQYVTKHIGLAGSNAIEAAQVEYIRNLEREEEKARHRQKQEQMANKRAQIALDKIHIERNYQKLEEELKKLKIISNSKP